MKEISIKQTLLVVLVFACLSIGLDLFKKLVDHSFDLNYVINCDTFLFEVAIEFKIIFLTGIITAIIVRKLDFNLTRTVLLLFFIFTFFYCFISYLVSLFVFFFLSADLEDVRINFYDSFVRFLPNGFNQGILFSLILFLFIRWKIEKQS